MRTVIDVMVIFMLVGLLLSIGWGLGRIVCKTLEDIMIHRVASSKWYRRVVVGEKEDDVGEGECERLGHEPDYQNTNYKRTEVGF